MKKEELKTDEITKNILSKQLCNEISNKCVSDSDTLLLNEYIEIVKTFLTKASSSSLERIADVALQQLQSISFEDYLQNPLIVYDGGRKTNLGHDKMEVARFSELLPYANKKYTEKAELIDYFKRMQTTTEDEEKERKENLRKAKLHNLYKYHLLPYSDGLYYHWNLDLDNVYDRLDDHPLVTGISAELLREDPCVVYAEKSATCGIFALVVADPMRMDIEKGILPMPSCCLGIDKDSCQDDITQLRYLCGRDEKWQPHPVTYCQNYTKALVEKKKKTSFVRK